MGMGTQWDWDSIGPGHMGLEHNRTGTQWDWDTMGLELASPRLQFSMVAFSSLARTLGKYLTIHSPPVLFLLFF